MIDFNPLFEFSRSHCIGTCTFLVPANLLATLQTLIFVSTRRSPQQVYWMIGAASLYALAMVLHVVTWLIIGVVMLPTFILLSLGSVCLVINVWAIAHPQSLATLLNQLVGFVRNREGGLGNRDRQVAG